MSALPDASEHPDLALPRLEPGSTFAGYRIVELLARGGMGVVYKAVEIDLDRTVALKIIAPEHTQDPTAVERFKREARLAASLEHPNIVPIHRGGEEGGVLFIAMRYVPGTNLRELIDRGPMDLPRVQQIVSQVAAGLDAAHRRGLVHRDVKPANILVTGEPGHEHVYLSDFGLTKQLGATSGDLTRVGGWVGTHDYVAPEQIRGEAADGRADVYSLGCVVYEMLTGEVAYPRDSDMAKLLAHVSDPPPMPRTRRPDLIPAFDDVVGRATAKNPSDRYATAGELAGALRHAIDQQEADRTRIAQAVFAPPIKASDEDQDGDQDGDEDFFGDDDAYEDRRQSTDEGDAPAATDPGARAPTHDETPSDDTHDSPAKNRRGVLIALLALLGCAVVAAVILVATSGGGSSPGAAPAQASGQNVTAELAAVPTNHVTGVGTAKLLLDGTQATVTIDASGLLNAPHAMHIHAGELGRCPPASAARLHGGHRAISTVDGEPFYGPPVTALTTSGPTSRNNILAFRRFPTTGTIHYDRRIDVGPAVAATIRNDNAVVVIHGIDYNRNGIYDFSALDRSDLRRSLPGETTAPALCGALVAAPAQSSDHTKTGHVTGGARVYTAALYVEDDPVAFECSLGDPLADRRPA